MKTKLFTLCFLLFTNLVIAQEVVSDSIITFGNKSYVKVEPKTYNTFIFKEYEWSYFSDAEIGIMILCFGGCIVLYNYFKK